MTIYHVTLFMLVASLGNDHVEAVVFINEKEKKKVLGPVWFMFCKTILCSKKIRKARKIWRTCLVPYSEKNKIKTKI